MATEAKKKRVCPICDTEHEVGTECPECGWNTEKEEAQAKAENERKRIRETINKPPKKKGFFD
jgi:ribosomal protein L32